MKMWRPSFGMFNIFRNRSNPRTSARGQGKHKMGSRKPTNWRRDLVAARKRKRQAVKKARRAASGRKHSG